MRNDPRLGRWTRINQLIADAAHRQGAEVEELTDVHTDYFMRLSKGERSVIVSKTRSPFLPQLAQSLSNNKYVSRRLLAGAGVPVVEDALVEDLDAPADRRLAEAMLERFGAVVVKPNWGNRGIGVFTDIGDMERLERCFEAARELDLDEEVLVEQQLRGHHLRVAVIGGRFSAAVVVEHLHLVGDGASTISALIEAENRDPSRGDYDEGVLTPLDRIETDDRLIEYLEVWGLELESILTAGESLPIWSEEAETIDVTDDLHPELAWAAETACRALGVDVGGVDLMVEDCKAPLRANAAVLEVNVLPALHLHALPTQGSPRPVFDAFVLHALGPHGRGKGSLRSPRGGSRPPSRRSCRPRTRSPLPPSDPWPAGG